MTEEEAVEEVLKGPFTDCVHCNGTGIFKRTALTATGILFVYEQASCASCGGTGKWERGDYKQACVIVGVEPKRLPVYEHVVYTGRSGQVKLWNRVLTGEEVAKFDKQQSEPSFKREYMGEWAFNDGKDDKVDFERDDTAEAVAYSMSCSIPVKP